MLKAIRIGFFSTWSLFRINGVNPDWGFHSHHETLSGLTLILFIHRMPSYDICHRHLALINLCLFKVKQGVNFNENSVT